MKNSKNKHSRILKAVVDTANDLYRLGLMNDKRKKAFDLLLKQEISRSKK